MNLFDALKNFYEKHTWPGRQIAQLRSAKEVSIARYNECNDLRQRIRDLTFENTNYKASVDPLISENKELIKKVQLLTARLEFIEGQLHEIRRTCLSLSNLAATLDSTVSAHRYVQPSSHHSNP